MPYVTEEKNDGSVMLVGEGQHEGTEVLVPASDLEGKSEAVRAAYLDRIFADTHLQNVRLSEGKGWKAP